MNHTLIIKLSPITRKETLQSFFFQIQTTHCVTVLNWWKSKFSLNTQCQNQRTILNATHKWKWIHWLEPCAPQFQVELIHFWVKMILSVSMPAIFTQAVPYSMVSLFGWVELRWTLTIGNDAAQKLSMLNQLTARYKRKQSFLVSFSSRAIITFRIYCKRHFENAK